MNFFKTKTRTPPDLVRSLRDAIPRLESGPPGGETRRRVCIASPSSDTAYLQKPDRVCALQANEDVSKNLQQIKAILLGDGGAPLPPLPPHPQRTDGQPKDPLPELVAQLAQETYSTDLLHHLVTNIARFEFESRKDVVQIFNNLLRRQIGSRCVSFVGLWWLLSLRSPSPPLVIDLSLTVLSCSTLLPLGCSTTTSLSHYSFRSLVTDHTH